jgi:hypothetical protein
MAWNEGNNLVIIELFIALIYGQLMEGKGRHGKQQSKRPLRQPYYIAHQIL